MEGGAKKMEGGRGGANYKKKASVSRVRISRIVGMSVDELTRGGVGDPCLPGGSSRRGEDGRGGVCRGGARRQSDNDNGERFHASAARAMRDGK